MTKMFQFGCDPDEGSESSGHVYPESLEREFDPIPVLSLPSFTELVGDTFEELHQENQGKYKIGEIVTYVGPLLEFQGNDFRIRASNRQDEKVTEYLLDGDMPYLVWEDEIQRNADCQCSEKTLESYGCMCKKRIQPG